MGFNVDATVALADAVAIPVIASGGAGLVDDIVAMLAARAGKHRRRDRRPGALRRAARRGASAALISAARAAALMLKVRVIPCLDVKDGRVVKGVNFVDLRDAGDPVEQAPPTTRRAPTS